jgi:D-inositol-3-phosphate glycosyltransferase
MRILIVSSYFPPHVGGVEIVAQQQAASLAAAGHAVVVATSRPDPSAPASERIDGYRVARLPASNLLEERTGIPYPFVGPAFCRALAGLVRRSDAVHIHDILYQPSQVAAALARRAAKPLYATAHVGLVEQDSRLVRGIQQLSTRLAGRYIWRHAVRVVTHNQPVYDYLRAHRVPAGRIALVRNGIDTSVFTPAPVADGAALRRRFDLPADGPLVLFVGRLVPKKGYRELIDAAGDGYHLVLAGPGQPPARLPAGVSCLGPVPRADLIALYRLADLFVLPATSEVFSIAIEEAMACGLPVITAEDPGYAGYGLDRRLLRLVEPSPNSLRQAIRTVLADPGLRREMGEYSRRLAVEMFDWRTNQAALLRLYDGVTGPADRPSAAAAMAASATAPTRRPDPVAGG